MAEGNGPSRLLPATENAVRYFHAPIEDGSDPVKLLTLRSNSFILVHKPTSTGIVPCKVWRYERSSLFTLLVVQVMPVQVHSFAASNHAVETFFTVL
jgi:hypothetical protein